MENCCRRALLSEFLRVFESYLFGNYAGSSNDPRMRLDKDRDLDVLCAVLSRVCEFIDHYGIFRLLDYSFVEPVVGYFPMHPMMTTDRNAPEYVS